jgi:3-methyladenine DNA glycosylase AlkD
MEPGDERLASAECAALLERLRGLADPVNVEGMARFGISSEGTLGVSVTMVRGIAREALRGRTADGVWRHALAACLWDSGVHEARILATILDEPSLVTRDQAEAWAADSDSWDITDGLCLNLLDRSPLAFTLAEDWSSREEVFVKRAAFALMAGIASHHRELEDASLLGFLGIIEREAHDERNFVKKAVSWALRQIGKRSAALHGPALEVATRLSASENRTERWVGRGAARELESDAVRERLKPG